MWNYNHTDELYHHGIKGMKWGRRRYQNKDGTLTPAGIKRYAQKGYAKDSYDSNKTVIGKVYDKYTGAHKIGGKLMYDLSSDKENKARAEKYLADKDAKAKAKEKQKALQKEYGDLEDQMTYGKNANTKKNAKLQKRMNEIDNELNPKTEKQKAKELKKMAKQEYKDFVKTRSKEILAGESFVGKAWDLLTDGHKYQAKIEYNLRDKDD